jgi:hypothetical protein
MGIEELVGTEDSRRQGTWGGGGRGMMERGW